MSYIHYMSYIVVDYTETNTSHMYTYPFTVHTIAYIYTLLLLLLFIKYYESESV